MKFICCHCGIESDKPTGHVNRAKKTGANIYCSKECSNEGRKSKKTDSQKRKDKSIYDAQYRKDNIEKIKKRNKEYYSKNKDSLYKKQREKQDNDEYRAKHAEYCRLFCQRYKERIRRYVRQYGTDWKTKTKFCISCEQEKHFMKFESMPVFPDGRRHICDECENEQKEKYGYTTRGTMTAMVMRRYTNLTRQDIAKHPYLIEANKYLILLKQLLDEKRKSTKKQIS